MDNVEARVTQYDIDILVRALPACISVCYDNLKKHDTSIADADLNAIARQAGHMAWEAHQALARKSRGNA